MSARTEMDRRTFLRMTAATATLAVAVPAGHAQAAELKIVPLPAPQMDGGRPLMLVLKGRRSSREFRPDPLPPQVLSNLLWAAAGVNRIETGGRTAPTASNSQDLEIYLAMADGVFVYEPKPHQLRQVLADDIRALTGRQAFAKDVPINLIYVSDLTRMTRAAPEDREFYAAAHTGYVSQNVYLYCASEGLATVVRASFDRAGLAKALNLGKEQKITLAQSVGYPKV